MGFSAIQLCFFFSETPSELLDLSCMSLHHHPHHHSHSLAIVSGIPFVLRHGCGRYSVSPCGLVLRARVGASFTFLLLWWMASRFRWRTHL